MKWSFHFANKWQVVMGTRELISTTQDIQEEINYLVIAIFRDKSKLYRYMTWNRYNLEPQATSKQQITRTRCLITMETPTKYPHKTI